MHPARWVLPVFVIFTVWWIYDGWFNPEMLDHRLARLANQVGSVPWLVGTIGGIWGASARRPSPNYGLPLEPTTHEQAAPLLRWNWGAFLLGPLWGIPNRVYLSLLLVPAALAVGPFHWLFSIVLGLKGSELAWNTGGWSDPSSFNRIQRCWSRWAFGLVGTALSSIAGMIAIKLAA